MAQHNTSTDTVTNEAELIAALRAQPDLFKRHPDLLAELDLPSAEDSVSLQQFQLRRLRADNQTLTKQLHDLSAIASQNEQLMRRLHTVTLAIMAVTNPSDVMALLTEKLETDFNADAVCLHPIQSSQPKWISECLESGQVRCGRFTQAKLQQLFPDTEPVPRSAAVVPVTGVGLIAIGAHDEQRFQADMGSLFLDLLAITVQHRLAPQTLSNA